jgi:hypothetical protein
MTNLKVALVAGTALSLALPLMPSNVQAQTTGAYKPGKNGLFLKVNGPSENDLARTRDGRLRKTDEEFTNEQAVAKFFADGKQGVYVEMRTGALADGSTPEHKMQGACTPIEMTQASDGKVLLKKKPGERFISNNDGNEYRNFNKPELMPINNGKNMLIMFNYQPNGTNDTRRYAKVLDANCNLIPLTDGNGEAREQVRIMAKNNDDCDMHQSGEGPCDISTDANGVTHMSCWAGCNGNGEDDGWLNDITVSCTNDALGNATGCQIAKNFDISLARREERSRGRCSFADEDPNTAICTWTEGNNQPQREGTWMAAVDVSSTGEMGPDAQSRLIWKEMIDGRKEMADGRDTYSSRAKQTRVMTMGANGNLVRTNQIIFQSGDLRGRNRDNEKGGTYRAFQLAVIKATRNGMEFVVPLTNTTDTFLGIDGTHLTSCGAVFGAGTEIMSGMTFLQGSHNGGGVQNPLMKMIGYDATARKFVDLGEASTGGSYDRHIYSNYLGNNPGNQGRNFAGCSLVKNPFAGINGNTDAYFVAHALTGKDPADVMRPELKPSSYVTLNPVVTTVRATRSNLTAEDEQGGCAAAQGSDNAFYVLALVGLGMMIVRRRA